MSVIVCPREATPEALAPLADLLEVDMSSSRVDDEPQQRYTIKAFMRSVSAWILFIEQSENHLALKVLCNYKDPRYDLETPRKRLNCQLEAFRCNSTFSRNDYYGLTRITGFDPTTTTISIGEISTNDPPPQFTSHAEYAIVMRELPYQRRLDYLLACKSYSPATLEELASYLTDHIIEMHEKLDSLPRAEAQTWGNFAQLRKKLEHNLALADPIGTLHSEPSASHHNSSQDITRRFNTLRIALTRLFTKENYSACLDDRIYGEHIKKCHADLKAPNIWVCENDDLPPQSPSQFNSRSTSISVLDAVDFNPMYSHIDTLSDFATLVTDMHTRIPTPELAEKIANLMLDRYLEETTREYDDARSIIQYYLVEKAYVGAAISIVYDNLPELGLRFLAVAEKQLKVLEQCLHPKNSHTTYPSARDSEPGKQIPALLPG